MQIINARNTHSKSLELSAVFVAYFTSFFILNSINNALPKIAADLDGMSNYA